MCVYQDGKKVVDLWGGHKDLERTVPWAEDTIVIMNSVAKSMCALCTHILIDRGLVDFDAPVARYWPEFAQAGKSGVLVRHVLSHTCGVIFCDRAPPGSWFDWQAHIRAIEQQEPAWAPGTKGAYNSINIGYILGEIVRRVTGRTVGDVPARGGFGASSARTTTSACKPDEIARVSDMHPQSEEHLLQDRRRRRHAARAARSARRRRSATSRTAARSASCEVASFGGHGSARAMARIYAMLAGNGAIDGVRLLSPAAVERASQLVWEDDCIMTQRRIRMGYGFMHNEPDTVPMGESMKAFGHTGTGGAFAWCDRERNMAFAYCTNFQREGPGIGPRGAALGVAAGGGRRPHWLA